MKLQGGKKYSKGFKDVLHTHFAAHFLSPSQRYVDPRVHFCGQIVQLQGISQTRWYDLMDHNICFLKKKEKQIHTLSLPKHLNMEACFVQ